MKGCFAIVPINLGCCPGADRCVLCPPAPPPPGPDVIEALIARYREDRAGPLRVGFYGGDLPSEAQLEAIGDLPFGVRVRPDRLTRAAAAALIARGVVSIELDALSLADDALKASGRPYRGALVLEQIDGLVGVEVGIVLAVGLPSSDHAATMADADLVAARAAAGGPSGVSSARIHPVLVRRGSGLAEAHRLGRYRPLTLGQAVTTCRGVLDRLEGARIRVIRVGVNPGPDEAGRVVAGPHHPALRQLVEARRTLAVLHHRLAGAASGARVAIRCHPADETRTRGPYNQHIRTLRATHRLAEVRVRPDPGLQRGQLVIEDEGDG